MVPVKTMAGDAAAEGVGPVGTAGSKRATSTPFSTQSMREATSGASAAKVCASCAETSRVRSNCAAARRSKASRVRASRAQTSRFGTGVRGGIGAPFLGIHIHHVEDAQRPAGPRRHIRPPWPRNRPAPRRSAVRRDRRAPSARGRVRGTRRGSAAGRAACRTGYARCVRCASPARHGPPRSSRAARADAAASAGSSTRQPRSTAQSRARCSSMCQARIFSPLSGG